jgi:predicted nucleic acid-binding protein
MNVVVTDTGPLLHLHQAGAAYLIASLGEIYMTPEVWSELQRHAPSFRQTGVPSWLRLILPSSEAKQQAVEWLQAGLLDAGEAEALAHAKEISADLFLSDDTVARTMGESLGLQVRGSLGVVLYLAATGALDQDKAIKVLDDLEHQSTLWMSAKVRSAARQALHKIFARD